MNNNDTLRRLRFALDLDDAELRRLCALVGVEVELPQLTRFMAREGEPDFSPCPDRVLEGFLDGLVLHRRGAPDPNRPPPPRGGRLDNNMILKKLRIALALKEPDMLALLKLGGLEMSPSELGALFRNQGNKHYRPCGDQVLRNCIRGLTIQNRGVGAPGFDAVG